MTLPAHLKRLAVLPVATAPGDWQAAEAREDLQVLLLAELSKAKAFELESVPSGRVRQWTGQESWRGDEALPPRLIERVRDELNCDALLFSYLRSFHPYRPLVVGWSLKLVEVPSSRVIWAADEVFDAGNAAVAKAARQHYQALGEGAQAGSDPDFVLKSPRRFSQYTMNALFATLPQR